MPKIFAYQLTLKWNGLLIKGLETTGLKFKPNFEETLLKEDEGNAVQEFIDFDTDLTFSGKTKGKETAEASTHEDFESLSEAATTGAEVEFVYGRMEAGARIVSGTCILMDWSEDADSKKAMGAWSGSAKGKKGTVEIGTFTV